MADIIGAIQRQLQSIGQQKAGNVFQGSLTPADKYKPSEYKTASPSGTPAYQYSYGPGKPYYKDPGVSGGPFSGGTPVGQPAMAGKPGGWTSDGTWSVGYQGSGEHPEISGNSAGGQYQSGSFGSMYTPDLSNPSKVAEYNRYLQSQGLPTLTGDPNEISAQFNKTGSYTPPSNVLAYTAPGKTGYTGELTGATANAGGNTISSPQLAGATATGSGNTQSSLMDAIVRKLQGGVGNVGSAITGMVGNLIRPPSTVNAQDFTSSNTQASPEYAKSDPWTLSLKKRLGQTISGLGSILTPFLGETRMGGGIGLGAKISGEQAPYNTVFGSTPLSQSSEAFPESPFYQAVQRRLGSADTGTSFEDLGGEQPPPEITPSTGGGNYGFQTQTPEVGQLVNEILSSLFSASPEQLAMTDTSSMDAWYQQAVQQSGLPSDQAALEAINKQVQVVADLLDNLDKDVTEESKNFLMTEAQRRKLVATRGKPLRDELTKLVAGANKYGVNIKNALAMLDQQIGLKKTEVQQRLEAQKAVEANRQSQLKGLTSLLPYLGATTGGQQLSSQTSTDIAAANSKAAMERALVNNQGGFSGL